MNADSVLTSTELLSHIFWFSDKNSVAKSMRVCQFWEAVGKPRIWRDLERPDGLKCLLWKLAPWNFTGPFTVPDHQDWSQFLQYTNLVHFLCVKTYGNLLAQMNETLALILEFISANRPAFEVFPNLCGLDIVVDDQQYLLQPSISLLHSGVRHWTIDFPRYPNRIEPFHIVLPVQRLSGLACVEIGRGVEAHDFLATCIGLEQLPCLASVVLPSHHVTSGVLQVLSRCSALQEIRTNDDDGGYGSCDMKHLLSHALRNGAFPNLSSLTLSACSVHLSQLLDDQHFPFHIRSLGIETHECEENMWHPIYEKVVARCQGVTELMLRDIIRDVPSSFTSIKAFLSYSLTRLEIDSSKPLTYSQAEIERLIHSLPMIEILQLAPYPRLTGESFGTFTFNHIPLFARHCRKLIRLAILLDTSQRWDDLPENTMTFAALRELDLGMSFALSFFAEASAVFKLFLPKLLPSNCQFTFYHNEYATITEDAIKRVAETKGVEEWRELSQRSRKRQLTL
ncbi:hypothetical protein E4T56_gene11330 [Termitomyces sp. T112]|nr:hypothetical protein E4T56_gene11330 [Termitomyces sp. T112]